MSTILRRTSRSWMHGTSRTRLPMSGGAPGMFRTRAKYFSGMKWVYASMRMERLRLASGALDKGSAALYARNKVRRARRAATGETHHAGRIGAAHLGALVHFAADQPDVPHH